VRKDTKEIENKNLLRFGWLAFFFVLVHFILILFSILPQQNSLKQVSNFSKHYVRPFFIQRWSMFAPCPVFENRFKVKYYFKDDTTSWIDPSLPILEKHQKYRVTYHGNIAVGQYNMLYWLKMDLDTIDLPINKPFNFQDYPVLKSKRGCRLLHNYVKGYARHNYSQKPLKTDIIIDYKNVKDSTLSTRYLLNNFK